MKRAKYQRTAVYTDRCLRSRTSSCHISRLPNEMITLIFSYLDVLELRASVAPVCKRWYELAQSPVLLRKLRFEGSRVATDTAKHLLKKAPLLRELTLVKRGDVDELLSQLCKTNRRVETLTIKQYSQESDSCRWLLLRAPLLNRLLRCCPCIRHLDLSEFNIRSGKFFHDLGRLLPNLTSLQLSHGRFLTPANVRDVAVHCSRLERLWLSGVNHCDNRDAWKDTYTTLFTLHWSTLTHLKFDAHKLTDYEFKVRKLLLTKGVARASFDVGSSIDRQCRGRPPVQRVFTMHGSRLLLAVCTALVATQTVCPGRAQDHTAKPEDTDSKNPEEGMETANPETVVEDGRTEPPGATNSAESQVLESNADKGSVKEVNVSTSTPETSITLYTLSREGEPCILMQMDASITFVYRTKSGEDREVSEYVPAEVETDGDCKEEDEANFALQWPNHVLTWNFAKTPGRERWYVNGVRLDVRTDSSKKFQYINKPGLRTLKSSKGHTMLFPTPVGKSYSCQSETSVELQNGDVSATVFLRGFKLQPFISRRDFGPVYECSPGGGPAFRDETAPIAVGSTLAVVVLLTVTGYGVYRYFKVKKVQYDTME